MCISHGKKEEEMKRNQVRADYDFFNLVIVKNISDVEN